MCVSCFNVFHKLIEMLVGAASFATVSCPCALLALDQVSYGFVWLSPRNAHVLVPQCREISFNRFVSRNVFFEMESKNAGPKLQQTCWRVQEGSPNPRI